MGVGCLTFHIGWPLGVHESRSAVGEGVWGKIGVYRPDLEGSGGGGVALQEQDDTKAATSVKP